MRPWMLEAPMVKLPESAVQAFGKSWEARDVALLPDGVPVWLFLEWLTRQGYLLHGSSRPDITEFEPRTPHDLSPDEFSERQGVFASSDALWSVMYALRDRTRVARLLNMALQIHGGGRWSPMRYFLSLSLHSPSRRCWSCRSRPPTPPLPVRLHDGASVDALSQADPWGFPWLD